MHLINCRNVHEALPVGLNLLHSIGVRRQSRAGDVILAPEPVTTLYQKPDELCCFWPERNVNPFATLFEGLWMLAGQNNVDYVARFIPRMRDFSDDGVTLHGAYGERWRSRHGFDQLHEISQALKANPDCRRQMLQIWDVNTDLIEPGKDVPCNTMVHFQVNAYGYLDMTVFNRSNDIIWGAYGADAPHFGMLLQYVAHASGHKIGRYWQISDNWHAYEETLTEEIKGLRNWARNPQYERLVAHSPYESGEVKPYPMFGSESIEQWDADLKMFMDEEDQAIGYKSPFFKKVAVPMIQAHRAFKENDGEHKYIETARCIKNIRATDWRIMCEGWIQRRWEKFLAA